MFAVVRNRIASVTSVSRRGFSIGYGNADSGQAVYSDTNFPLVDGRVLHLDVGPGDVVNRIMSVGDATRAERLSKLLDDPDKTRVVKSGRGFVTYTGTFDKVPVSIVATGMGVAMMDFVVRESRAVVEGNKAIIRFGSCGGLRPDVPAGSVVVTGESGMVQRNPDAFGGASASTSASDSESASASASESSGLKENPYRFLRPVAPDSQLTTLLEGNLEQSMKGGGGG